MSAANRTKKRWSAVCTEWGCAFRVSSGTDGNAQNRKVNVHILESGHTVAVTASRTSYQGPLPKEAC